TWQTENPPSGVAPPTVISCPSPSDCVAAGAEGTTFVTTDGGRRWRTGSLPSNYTFAAFSCPTAGHCFALNDYGGALFSTTDGGRTWSLVGTAIQGAYTSLFSCPSVSVCW